MAKVLYAPMVECECGSRTLYEPWTQGCDFDFLCFECSVHNKGDIPLPGFERIAKLQGAIDGFLAPIYMEVGRLISEGGETPLADVLSGYSVNVTCADVQRLYDNTYPEEIADSDPTGPGIVSVDEFVEIITGGHRPKQDRSPEDV